MDLETVELIKALWDIENINTYVLIKNYLAIFFKMKISVPANLQKILWYVIVIKIYRISRNKKITTF